MVEQREYAPGRRGDEGEAGAAVELKGGLPAEHWRQLRLCEVRVRVRVRVSSGDPYQGDEGEEGDDDVGEPPSESGGGGAEVAALGVCPDAGDEHLEADLAEHEQLEDDVHEVDLVRVRVKGER